MAPGLREKSKEFRNQSRHGRHRDRDQKKDQRDDLQPLIQYGNCLGDKLIAFGNRNQLQKLEESAREWNSADSDGLSSDPRLQK